MPPKAKDSPENFWKISESAIRQGNPTTNKIFRRSVS